MKSLTIAGNNLRRTFRQPSNIFFVFIFPMLLILLLGVSFGGEFKPRVGVYADDPGPMGEELVSSLAGSGNLEITRIQEPESVRSSVERGTLQGGVLLPDGYSGILRSGGQARVEYLLRPDQLGQQVRTSVESTFSRQAVILRAARFSSGETGISFDEARTQAAAVALALPEIEVEVRTAGETLYPEDRGRFGQGASSQLLLFVFLTSLTGSVALIETRRLGLSRRMLSTPTPARTLVSGEMLGRLGVALIQGTFIMAGSWLVFGVSWGNPAGAAALLVLFSLTAAGAGMLLGSVFSTEQQAIAVGLLLGLGLAALGGSMVPLEAFSDTMRKVAHITPHAWALDGFTALVRRGEGVDAIITELAVLGAYAAVLLSLATWRLRRAITG
ncbi:MAG: ABC transporter permease [Thermoleophilia bacterium]|nr:ABC transporter permease [Thermoleophilia bacterium]